MNDMYDVVVVGGGAAGLSAGVALARSRRSVLVIDAGDPRNAPAAHVHNFLSRDGASPAELYATGRAEVMRYGGDIVDDEVMSLAREGDRFAVEVGGRTVLARRVLIATGARDELPDLPGLAQRWGRDVLHCPYCHGWEVRDRRVGILWSGPNSMHQTLLFRQLTDTVTVLPHRGARPNDEQRRQLDSLDVAVVDSDVAAVETTDDHLSALRLVDGGAVALDALVVAPVCRARADLLASLGVEPTEFRIGDTVMGTYVPTDAGGATGVAGVRAAGNVADVTAQVISAAAAGLMVAAAINMDLIMSDAPGPTSGEPPATADEWDELYSSAETLWSGEPNGALMSEVTGLTPGRALDVGCGEGADAIWLAQRGWDVTALDVSEVALDRARAHAAAAGVTITFLHRALLDDAGPATVTYDLVSAQYPALRTTSGHDAEHALLDAVAPGGTLLVVHHDVSDPSAALAHGFDPAEWVGPHDVAHLLDNSWAVDVDERRERTVSGGAGAHHTHDIVLRARRTT